MKSVENMPNRDMDREDAKILRGIEVLLESELKDIEGQMRRVVGKPAVDHLMTIINAPKDIERGYEPILEEIVRIEEGACNNEQERDLFEFKKEVYDNLELVADNLNDGHLRYETQTGKIPATRKAVTYTDFARCYLKAKDRLEEFRQTYLGKKKSLGRRFNQRIKTALFEISDEFKNGLPNSSERLVDHYLAKLKNHVKPNIYHDIKHMLRHGHDVPEFSDIGLRISTAHSTIPGQMVLR